MDDLPHSMTIKFSWILMLIVGLIPFSYGVAFVIAYAFSAASGSQAALLALVAA